MTPARMTPLWTAAAVAWMAALAAGGPATTPTTQPDWRQPLAAAQKLIRQGHYRKAQPLLQTAADAAAPDSLAAAAVFNAQGRLDRLMGHYDQAGIENHQALAIRTRTLGKDDPLVAQTLENLGELDMARCRFPQAQEELTSALAIRTKTLGPASAPTAQTMSNLGQVELEMSRFDQGETLCRRAVEIENKVMKPDDPARADGWDNLADAYYIRSDLVQAKKLLSQSLLLRCRVLGDDHPEVGTSYDNLGSLYMAWGNLADALRCFRLAAFTRQNALGMDDPDTMESVAMVAATETAAGASPDQTIPVLQHALTVQIKELGPDNAITQTVEVSLANACIQINRTAEARELLTAALASARRTFGQQNINTANIECALANYYAGVGGHSAQALALYKQSLATTEKLFGPKDRNTGFVLQAYAPFLKSLGQDAQAAILQKRAQDIQDADLRRNPPPPSLPGL